MAAGVLCFFRLHWRFAGVVILGDDVKAFGLILPAVFVCGCSYGPTKTADEWPAGTKRFVGGGNHIHDIVPVTMEDGTRCVVVVKNSAGTAISCNWK